MFRIEDYINNLIQKLKAAFGERLIYIGLQGSYLRGEATVDSDIDIMAVIDNLSVDDLQAYRDVLVSVGNFDKSCGFICSKEDLKNWNPLEISHLLHTTKDYYGILKNLIPEYTETDIRNFIKLSLNNLYHELCHRYIHAERDYNISRLPMTCKSIFYILQNMYYLKSGNFVMTKRELLEHLQVKDKAVLELSMTLQNCSDYDFDKAFGMLFEWCQSSLNDVACNKKC